MCGCLLSRSPTGDLAHSPGMYPDWESNWQSFGSQVCAQSTELHQPGHEKKRILKATREKERVTYKEVSIRLAADFSKETLQARKGWKEVFKVMKSKDVHARFLYLAKLSFRMEGLIKCFPEEKVKVKVFIISKPLLHEMLKGLI